MAKIKNNILSIAKLCLIIVVFYSSLAFPIRKVDAATTISYPDIEVTYLGTTPKQPIKGEPFKIKYQINPLPFQYAVTNPKEIVLVLDGSASMEGTRLNNMKTAANNFINRLKDIPNLKIAVVAYSSVATINPSGSSSNKSIRTVGGSSHEIPSYSSYGASFLNANDTRLTTSINAIKALGGTNIGEGLRQAEYLLSLNKDPKTNKSIVLMTDGLPTFYTVKVSGKSYDVIEGNYTTIDSVIPSSTNPRITGSGSNYDSKAHSYAKEIGSIISSKNYNVFSVGYGLDSTGTNTLKDIHNSMGGVSSGADSSFFSTDTGAIDAVFQRIADKLENSYSITDATLKLQLPAEIIAKEGFTFLGSTGSSIKVDPIVYTLGNNNWYTAEPQIVEFSVQSDKTGNFDFFFQNSTLNYTDIFGNNRAVSIPGFNVTIQEAPNAYYLLGQITFDKPGYLIGDIVYSTVSVYPSISSTLLYENVNFAFDSLPSNFGYVSGSNGKLSFGNIDSIKSGVVSMKINDDSSITATSPKTYNLTSNISYIRYRTQQMKYDMSTALNVKRGQIKIKVYDQSGHDITNFSKVSIPALTSNVATYTNGYYLFNSIPTGNHQVIIESLPKGCTPPTQGSNAFINITYNNNIGEYVFRVNGVVDLSLVHGIYQGFNGNATTSEEKISILQSNSTNPIELVKNTELTFGASFNYYNTTTFTLQLDSKLVTTGPVSIYVVEQNSLKLLDSDSVTALGGNSYQVSNLQPGSKVLVLYQGKLTEANQLYQNDILIGDIIKTIQIKTRESESNLPNLF